MHLAIEHNNAGPSDNTKGSLHNASGDASAKFFQELSKNTGANLNGPKPAGESGLNTTSAVSTLPKLTIHGNEGSTKYTSTIQGTMVEPGNFESNKEPRDSSSVQHSSASEKAERQDESNHAEQNKPVDKDKSAAELEKEPRASQKKTEKSEHSESKKEGHKKGSSPKSEEANADHDKRKADQETRDLEGNADPKVLPGGQTRPEHQSLYVKGMGQRNPVDDPQLNDLGRAIINAEKTSDNFQLMKSIKGLSDTDLRNEVEKAQSVINRDLGGPSLRIGVDDDNIHIYFKKTDLTLPYNSANDKKQAPDVNDSTLRNELADRLQSNVSLWGPGLTKLSTSELALFDGISRSDGPALRSAMSGIKEADELDRQLQNVAEFCNSRGLSNWATIIWSNDEKSLAIHNGVSVFKGKFPIEEKDPG